MSKRFTFKSVLTLVVILLSALVLVACGDDDKEVVDAALENLVLPFQGSDTATSVTQDLTLPTEVGSVEITWVSSHPAVISAMGEVNRPAFGQANVSVTLTATLSKGGEEAEKEFTVIVIALPQTDADAVSEAFGTLAIGFSTGNTSTTVTGNLTLPATQGSTSVSWVSSNTAVISNAGAVTRPAKGEANVTLTLTATITKGSESNTKVFTLTVLAIPLTDQDYVDEALAELAVGLTSGDTLLLVTGNVTLPATQNDLAVVWVSDTPAVISNTGVVTRPAKGEAAVTVELEATVTKGIAFGTKTFELIVQPEEYTIDDVLAELDITGTDVTYNETTDRYTTTSDLVLPTEIFGFDIAWSSANTAVITNAGVVTRPAYGQTDSTVFLTATIDEEEYIYIVVVSAITVKPNDLVLSEAFDILLIPGITGGIVDTDLVLPLVVGQDGATVTWVSDTPDVVSNAGVVVRQPEATFVTLTATIHFNGQELDKEFDLTILAFAEFVEVENVAAAIAWYNGDTDPDPENARNLYVKIPGVTILGRTVEGFMLGDASGMLFAYTQSTPLAKFEVGEVFDIYGLLTYFNGNIQLDGTEVGFPIQGVLSDADVYVPTATPVTDVVAYIASLPTEYTEYTSNLNHQYIQLTAKVRVQSTDNYHTMFVNPDYEGGDINTAAQSPFTDNALIVYYKSNKTAFAPFDGLTVTVNVFLYTLRNDRNLYTVIFTGTADDIVFDLTDTEIVDLAGDVADQNIPAEVLEDSTLSLPTSLLGTTVTWASSNEAVINPTTGDVVLPEVGQVTVTLTATITKGEVTKEFAIVVKVGELEILTVAEALAISSGTVRVQATVTGLITNRTFALQDETGAMAVYVAVADIATWTGYIGKEIDLIGSRSAYNGLLQISPATVTVMGDGTIPAPVNVDGVALDATGLLPYRGMFITRTGLEVVSVTVGSYSNTTVVFKDPTTEETITLYWNSYVTVEGNNLTSFLPGDTVNLVNIPLGWNNGPQLGYTNVNQIVKVEFVPETDQEKVDAAADALLAQPATVTTNLTLTLEDMGLYDTTVTWTSSNTAVITDAGVVTVPFDSTSVTMTATVTLNLATATREFIIVVEEDVLTVAEARATAVDELVIVEVLITKTATDVDGNVVAFAEDETAGIYLYGLTSVTGVNVVEGNIVRVYGTRKVFNDLVQISVITDVVVISSGNPVAPLVVTDPSTIATVPGEFVQVSGYLRQLVTSGSDFYLLTDLGFFQLRLASSSDLDPIYRDAITNKLYSVAAGTMITVNAGVGQFYSTMQLMLFDADDITVGTVGTDAQLLAAAAANLTLPEESAELIADLTLPTTGYFGTTVAWASSNEAAISTAGVVTRPAEGVSNAEVTLTYTVSLGLEVFEGTLDFTVLAETGVATEQIIYQNGFESAEGYSVSTTYNNTTENLFGPSGNEWGMIFGTATTTGAISGSQSAQMRWYTGTPTSFGSLTSKFTLTDVTKVEFKANAYANIGLTVSYSLNGTDWLGAEAFVLSTTAGDFTYTINVTGDVYLRFELTTPGATPTATSRLTIDDIVVYGLL